MFGLEAIFRNGVPVGHLRRSDYGFFIDKTIGYGYIRDPDGGVVKTRRSHPTREHTGGGTPYRSGRGLQTSWWCRTLSSPFTVAPPNQLCSDSPLLPSNLLLPPSNLISSSSSNLLITPPLPISSSGECRFHQEWRVQPGEDGGDLQGQSPCEDAL